MSSLLNRYVHAVEHHMPAEHAADIAAELRATIQARFDEDAAEKQRPLTATEEADVLRSIGRPVVVAGRYGRVPYLVGPELYPYYRATLRALAAICGPLVAVAVVVTALTADGPLRAALGVVGKSFNAAWVVFGIVTFIFWQMDRSPESPHLDDEWDPLELPEMPAGAHTVPRAASISHACVLTGYLLWWTGQFPLGRGLMRSVGLDLPVPAPIWDALFAIIAVMLAVSLVLTLIDVWRPEVSTWRRAADMACDIVVLGILFVLVNAEALILAPAPESWGGRVDLLDDIARAGLVVLGGVIALRLFDHGAHLFGLSWGERGSWRAALAANARALRRVHRVADGSGRRGLSKP